MKNEIKVMYGDIKRETVIIDPNVAVVMTGNNEETSSQTNIIAEGTNSRDLLKKIYGR